MHSVHYHHCHWLPIRLCGYFTPSGRKYSNPWCHLPYPPVADNHVLPRCISTWHACHACAFDLNVSTAYFSRTRLPNLRSAPINSWMTDDIHMLFLRHNLPTDPDGSACPWYVSSLLSLAISGRFRAAKDAGFMSEGTGDLYAWPISTRIYTHACLLVSPRRRRSHIFTSPLTHLHTYSPSTTYEYSTVSQWQARNHVPACHKATRFMWERTLVCALQYSTPVHHAVTVAVRTSTASLKI